MKCIKMLTFLSLDEIADMETWADNRINEKKEVLAYELTKLVHGEEEATKAKEASHAIFAGGASENMPTTEVTADIIADGKVALLDLLTLGKLAPSRSEAKRLVMQGGVFIGDEKASSFSQMIDAEALKDGVIIRKGKKVFHRFILK
jgi:tyrosyl-tRNA synthetase